MTYTNAERMEDEQSSKWRIQDIKKIEAIAAAQPYNQYGFRKPTQADIRLRQKPTFAMSELINPAKSHPTKRTDEIVAAMKEDCKNGLSYLKIAKKYKVSDSTVKIWVNK